MDPDYLELLQLLNFHKVRYLIIGGYAVINYTEPRYTKDLDLWIDCSINNAKKTLKALSEFGAPVANLQVDDLAKPGLIYVFGAPPLRVDILNRVSGATFKNAWDNKKVIKLDKVKANFVSLAVLKRLKKSASRPNDLADLEKLNKI